MACGLEGRNCIAVGCNLKNYNIAYKRLEPFLSAVTEAATADVKPRNPFALNVRTDEVGAKGE